MTARLVSIPYADIRDGTPLDLLAAFPERAKSLATASMDMFGPARHIARNVALPLGDRASRAWLERTQNPYLDEIRAIARTEGIRGAYFLNVCFEWGCTCGAFRAGKGTLMRRVLDWPFPSLGESVVVAHQKGPAGEFYNVTWPGLSAIYQAMAPGRLSAAINQAPMRQHGGGFVGDWTRNRFLVHRSKALPAAHLLRRVFETAADYSEAREMLCAEPLAVPAIFILAGIEDGQGCVIERTEQAFRVRDMNGDRVCATNHFETALDGRWLPRPIDSQGRLRAANALSCAATNDAFGWFTPPIANINSRLVVNANAGTGELAVLGTAGIRPVTEVFALSC